MNRCSWKKFWILRSLVCQSFYFRTLSSGLLLAVACSSTLLLLFIIVLQSKVSLLSEADCVGQSTVLHFKFSSSTYKDGSWPVNSNGLLFNLPPSFNFMRHLHGSFWCLLSFVLLLSSSGKEKGRWERQRRQEEERWEKMIPTLTIGSFICILCIFKQFNKTF